ncbi:ABC transporter permease [Halobacterium bonnevillei]|jgi:spermidine/putrescine transport system permease protein|uniref:ABC transporter permease subunit n=1 Tax=Halobacterium bonnevillei TaxID=2692200 RepID=A0A6B0SJC4_9EURY|nr:ABC transporter permease [Halobacterium bonnevillei]MXR21287.1 ABC transporter permease subunit [Halobacterium bonnevillei]
MATDHATTGETDVDAERGYFGVTISSRVKWNLIRAVTVAVYVMMILPLVVIVINSFNPSRLGNFPPQTLSIRWYEALLADELMLRALLNSLQVGVAAAFGAGLIGTLTAMGFVRNDFRMQDALVIVLLSPLLIPPIIVGVAATIFFGQAGIPRSLGWLVVMHTLLGLPYAFLIIRSQLYLFDETLEEAARTLGADRLTTFREVTFPIISPSIITSMVIVFVISFGEFTATQFWVKRTTTTVPVVIFSMLRTSISPKIDALATVMLVVTILVPLIVLGIRRWVLKT